MRESILVSSNLENCLIEAVSYEEICGYLNAADFALFFRDKNIANKIAFPIRIGEYLLCVLPIIAAEEYNIKLSKINLDKFDFSLPDEKKRFQISQMDRFYPFMKG